MSTSHSALRPERLSQLHQGQGARVFVPDMDALFQRMGGLSLQRHRRGHPQAPSHSDVHPRAASRVVPRGSSTTNNPDHPRYDVPPSSVSLGSRRSRTAARPSTPQYSYEVKQGMWVGRRRFWQCNRVGMEPQAKVALVCGGQSEARSWHVFLLVCQNLTPSITMRPDCLAVSFRKRLV